MFETTLMRSKMDRRYSEFRFEGLRRLRALSRRKGLRTCQVDMAGALVDINS